jgi:hypothetical protein
VYSAKKMMDQFLEQSDWLPDSDTGQLGQVETVKEKIRNLRPNTAAGPDRMSPDYCRICWKRQCRH